MEMLAINLSSRSKITCDIYSKTGQDTVLLYKIDWQETMRPFSKLNKFKHLQNFLPSLSISETNKKSYHIIKLISLVGVFDYKYSGLGKSNSL